MCGCNVTACVSMTWSVPVPLCPCEASASTPNRYLMTLHDTHEASAAATTPPTAAGTSPSPSRCPHLGTVTAQFRCQGPRGTTSSAATTWSSDSHRRQSHNSGYHSRQRARNRDQLLSARLATRTGAIVGRRRPRRYTVTGSLQTAPTVDRGARPAIEQWQPIPRY